MLKENTIRIMVTERNGNVTNNSIDMIYLTQFGKEGGREVKSRVSMASPLFIAEGKQNAT